MINGISECGDDETIEDEAMIIIIRRRFQRALFLVRSLLMLFLLLVLVLPYYMTAPPILLPASSWEALSLPLYITCGFLPQSWALPWQVYRGHW